MGNKMEWLKWPLEHYSISLLIVGILFVLGVFGMYDMPKDEFPHATIRQGVVVAVYPGATSEEVEQQVARPLERYLFTYGEVNRVKTTTTSQNGMCIVMVKLNDDVNNKDEVWSKIKHGLNDFKMQLPSGVLAIVVNDDFGNTSALLIAIESSERSYRELKDYSDDLSDRLRRIPSVANVKLFGEQKALPTAAGSRHHHDERQHQRRRPAGAHPRGGYGEQRAGDCQPDYLQRPRHWQGGKGA